MKKIIEAFKKTTTSKKLTALVVAFWFIVIIADIVIYLITGKTINEVADYVNTAFLVILGAYFTKSGIENAIAIQTTNSIETITNNQPEEGDA